MSDVICWGLHAGRSSEADHLFRKQNRIGIGWCRMRDLPVPERRESIVQFTDHDPSELADGGLKVLSFRSTQDTTIESCRTASQAITP